MELGLFATSIGATVAMQRAVDRKMRSSVGRECGPLIDVVHETFADLSKYERYIDLAPVLLGVIALYFAVRGRLEHEKILIVLSIVFFARSLTFSCTLLPSPLSSCMVKGSQSVGGCHDCIFSGHTAMTLVLAYFLQKAYPSCKCALLSYCVIASLLITMTRAHYTIDVLVAWIVVYAIIKTIDDAS